MASFAVTQMTHNSGFKVMALFKGKYLKKRYILVSQTKIIRVSDVKGKHRQVIE